MYNENLVLKITASKVDMPFVAELLFKKAATRVKYFVLDNGEIILEGEKTVDSDMLKIVEDIEALPWSPHSPKLYTLSLTVEYKDGQTETISDTFGFRYFSTDNKYIYLNGYPFYMRAYIRGAAAHEHANNCSLSEYDFYKKNFVMAKRYGYNTVRFHSVIPTDECFRAADEMGMLIHIEMRAENLEYDNLQEMLYGKNDFVSNDELLVIINRLYNHPSFMVYCVGNEIRHPGAKPRIKEIRDFIKSYDNTRLFIDTCAHGEYDRDYVDFDVQHMGYYFPYGRNKNMFSDTDNLLGFGSVNDREMLVEEDDGGKIRRGIKFTRPLLAHEVCHYTSWRDYYALKEKFNKYNIPAPWWVDEEIKLLEAKGYKDNFPEMLNITKQHQTRLWKCALEGIRASHLLSGFHMLQFADTDKYENSNGVVDCFDDPHGISPEAFGRFNADTVVLARLPKQIFAYGELVKIPVLLSQFAINPEPSARFTYKLIANGAVIREGSLNNVDTSASGLYDIASLEFRIPTFDAPSAMTLEVTLAFLSGNTCVNSWEMWAFAPAVPKQPIKARVDMREDYLNNAFSFDESAPLTITDKLDDTLFDRLDRGENVLFIYRTDWCRHLLNKGMPQPKYSFVHTWERYKGVIWDRGTLNGGYVERELLNSLGFPTDRDINFQYYHLIDDSDKINLDDFPIKVHSIISGLDKANRDRFDVTKFAFRELRYDRTMRNFSYAFDLKVGKGKLLVTGFNFTGVESLEPSSVAMLRALVDYCYTDSFANGESITTEALRQYLISCAKLGPQKEGMMTQYWQLDAEPVESMAYWTESERYLREDFEK